MQGQHDVICKVLIQEFHRCCSIKLSATGVGGWGRHSSPGWSYQSVAAFCLRGEGGCSSVIAHDEA